MELGPSIENFITQHLVFDVLCLPYNYPVAGRLEAFQDGYRYNSVKGESLITGKEGDWQETWFVIASNYFTDPFFIDLSEDVKDFPVYFSFCRAGQWAPVRVSSSITAFSKLLETLKSLDLETDKTAPIKFLQQSVEINSFWQEVIEAYEGNGAKNVENEDATTDTAEWILGKLFITDLGRDKLKVISYLKTLFSLTPTEALAFSKQPPIEVASGYLVHLKKKKDFLEKLGASVEFVKDG